MGLVPLLWLRHCRLVLQATNRIPAVLIDACRVVRAIVVAQQHAGGQVSIPSGLRGTPEVGEVANIAEAGIAVPSAGRERREAIGIRAIATITVEIFPTRLRL